MPRATTKRKATRKKYDEQYGRRSKARCVRNNAQPKGERETVRRRARDREDIGGEEREG